MFDAILKARIDAFVLGRHGLMVSGLRKRRHDLLSVTSGNSNAIHKVFVYLPIMGLFIFS